MGFPFAFDIFVRTQRPNPIQTHLYTYRFIIQTYLGTSDIHAPWMILSNEAEGMLQEQRPYCYNHQAKIFQSDPNKMQKNDM